MSNLESTESDFNRCLYILPASFQRADMLHASQETWL